MPLDLEEGRRRVQPINHIGKLHRADLQLLAAYAHLDHCLIDVGQVAGHRLGDGSCLGGPHIGISHAERGLGDIVGQGLGHRRLLFNRCGDADNDRSDIVDHSGNLLDSVNGAIG